MISSQTNRRRRVFPLPPHASEAVSFGAASRPCLGLNWRHFAHRLGALTWAIVLVPLIGVPAAWAESPDHARAESNSTEDYRLVWSDEFDRDGKPDPAKWTFERGFVRNEELQWYQPENASCQDGKLVIVARRERVRNPQFDAESNRWQRRRPHAEYTSASLLTRGLASWQYGRFEVRTQIDARPGLWPAIWTLGTKGRWPACGEIDLMEYYDGLILANAAWAGRRSQARWDDSRMPLTELGGPDWAKSFHVWRMDWDERRIALYVNDQLLNEIDLSRTINATRGQENPFHQPHYLILNLAIGGTRGGDPSGTEFPARFVVDFVRVYQRQ
jgi:beta-glucanase (GH16 family)